MGPLPLYTLGMFTAAPPLERRLLLVCLVVAAVARLGFAFAGREYVERTSRETLRDTVGYNDLARHALEHGAFAKLPPQTFPRPPLYPLFLAGVRATLGDGYAATRIAQTLLQLLTLLLLYRLARAWFGPTVGLLASYLFALNPFFVFYTAFELSETLAVFLVVLIASLVQHGSATLHPAWAAALGFALAAATLCRPPLGQAGLLLLAGTGLARRADRAFWVAAGSACLSFLVAVAPWICFHAQAYGRPVIVYMGLGRSLYEANNPTSVTGTGIIGVDFQLDPAIEALPFEERDRIYLDRALAHIREEPGLYVGRCLWRFYRLWQPVPYAPEFADSGKILVVLLGEGIFLPFFVAGLWLTRQRWRDLLWPYALGITLTAAHTLIVSGMRYRVPVMPFALILAAFALTTLIARWNRLRAADSDRGGSAR